MSSDGLTVVQLAESLSDSIEDLALGWRDERKPILSETEVQQLRLALSRSTAYASYLRNELLPVNQLPPKILSHIFALCQHRNTKFGASYDLGWIAVTRVCTYWRQAALSSRDLWSTIPVMPTNSRSLVDVFLSRSRGAPLTILCGGCLHEPNSDAKNPDFQDFFAVNGIQRMRRCLKAVADFGPFDKIVRIVVEPGFPIEPLSRIHGLLQHLGRGLSLYNPQLLGKTQGSNIKPNSINNSHPPPSGEDSLQRVFSEGLASDTCKELDLFAGAASHFLKYSKTSPFPYLTHLRLCNFKIKESDQQDNNTKHLLSEFLRAISTCSHHLEDLSLIGVHPKTQDDTTNERYTVTLPRLKRLEIGDWHSSGDISCFLSHLRFPSSASRLIWGENLKSLPSLLFPQGQDVDSTRPTISRVVLSSIPGRSMVGITEHSVHIQGSIDYSTYYPLFRDNLSVFSSVEDLVVAPFLSPPANTSEWSLLLKALPNIRRIIMRDADVSGILDALSLNSKEAICPALEGIDIQFCDFTMGGNNAPAPTDGYRSSKQEGNGLLGRPFTTEPMSTVLGLILFAQKRHREGHSLTSITLRFGWRLYLTQAEIGDLQQMSSLVQDELEKWVDGEVIFRDDPNYRLNLESEEERAEREKEWKDDCWYLARKQLQGVWPTQMANLAQWYPLLRTYSKN